MDKTKLKKLLIGLTNYDSGLGSAFKGVEKELTKVADDLWSKAEVRTAENVKKKISELQDVVKESSDSMNSSLETFKKEVVESEQNLIGSLEKKLSEFKALINSAESDSSGKLEEFKSELDAIGQDIVGLGDRVSKIPNFKKDIDQLEVELVRLVTAVKRSSEETSKEFETKHGEVVNKVEDLKSDMMSKFAHRGGNANRQINVNSSVMSVRYTDINFQESGNIGWSVADDNDLKRVNIRASILVGGGGGTTRTTSVLSVSSTLTATAGDYTYFINDGIRLTFPTAISNTNRYSLKNTSTSSVQLAAATGQTIDDGTTAVLTRQYEAVDVMSNGSVWGIF